jgi:rhodanese-related sulfurtransferase
MISALKSMFGLGPTADFAAMVKNGAMIIDVRTKGEFSGGHIKGSVNIPLNELENHLKKIPKDKVIITCCASGMRSGSAKGILQSKGYAEVYNGGGWSSLQAKL